MTTYVTNDGVEFSAESVTEVVTKLRAFSFADSGLSDEAFMREVRMRALVQTGASVQLGPTECVEDLLRCGFLKIKAD
jgi:hypothetical protein